MLRMVRKKEPILYMEEREWTDQVHESVLCRVVLVSAMLLSSGYFMEPAVFTGAEDHMMIAREESFGPVMVISVFENG